MTNTDYRTMEAGRELDRLIAERLGYRAVERTWRWYLLSHDVLETSLDEMLKRGWHIRSYPTETEAWNIDVSRYSTDLNAAIALLPTDGYTWSLHYSNYDDPYTAVISGVKVDSPEYFGDASTPALAICRAWLAWKDSQS